MERYAIKNIEFLKLKDETAKTNYSYGLSQEWYKDDYQILAGCGATVAATILTYYKQNKKYKSLEVNNVLPLMEELWNYLLPIKNMGLNSTKLFYEGIEKYFLDKAKTINYSYIDVKLNEKISIEKIVAFLKEELANDRPVAFLNLCNGEEEVLDKWHWVTVYEIFTENDEYFVNILDDREIKKINLSLWYNTMTNDGGFVSFYF